ncbi:MAG: DUF1993 family protein [Steroidobacteraceae bacterium]
MRTVLLEFAAGLAPTIAARLEAAGVAAVSGYDPVPMRGRGTAPDTVVVTVLVPPGVSVESLHGIAGVLRVMGDPALGPLSSHLEYMMKLTLFDACVPVGIQMLTNLTAILEKAAAHAEARKFDATVLVGSRLYPDMFALARQVQIASDSAKAGAARLAGLTPPSWEDNEATLPELVARLQKTVAFLETLQPAQFEGAEERTITWTTRAGTRTMRGLPYLLHHMLPTLFFHVTTAYNILRHNGVELGKKDYLGPPPG